MKLTKETLMKIIKEELAETWHDRSEVPAEETGMAQHIKAQGPDQYMALALEIAPAVGQLMTAGLSPWGGAKSQEVVHEIIAKHLVAAYEEAIGQGAPAL